MSFSIDKRKLALFALLGMACGIVAAQEAGGDVARPVAFRNSQVEIKSIQIPSESLDSGADGAVQEDLSLLSEKKQTVESQLRDARAKLAGYRRALEIQTASHNFEKADLSRVAVKDWEAREKANEAQLAQINKEMQGPMQAVDSNAGFQEGLILPGDNLEVFVVEDTSFNNRYQVRRGGYIILPAVGRVSVAGKMMEDAEKSVKAALQSSQLKNATVMIEKVQGSDVEHGPVIYLSGEFKSPRPFRIPSGTKHTLVSCILSCGGVTDKADLTHVKVMRVAGNKGVVEEVNVERILQGGGLGSDLTLDEGDVVTIPGGVPNVVYMTGNVKNQGSFAIKPGDNISAYSAILKRGGFSRFADEKKAFVLRATSYGSKVRIPLDVAAIKKGKASDIQLQGNDIVIVPEKFFSF